MQQSCVYICDKSKYYDRFVGENHLESCKVLKARANF